MQRRWKGYALLVNRIGVVATTLLVPMGQRFDFALMITRNPHEPTPVPTTAWKSYIFRNFIKTMKRKLFFLCPVCNCWSPLFTLFICCFVEMYSYALPLQKNKNSTQSHANTLLWKKKQLTKLVITNKAVLTSKPKT